MKTIDLLVHNVGAGQNGLFDLLPWETQRKSIDLNIQSTPALTYGLIPRIRAAKGRKKRGGGDTRHLQPHSVARRQSRSQEFRRRFHTLEMAEGSRLCGGREPIRPWNAKAGIISRRIGFLRAKGLESGRA
jgi:hypothetical protein